MKLDRNEHSDGRGKYELRNLRTGEVVEDCGPGEPHEFFVIMLKDRHAIPALAAYAASIHHFDTEFAEEVRDLCKRAGLNSRFCHDPD